MILAVETVIFLRQKCCPVENISQIDEKSKESQFGREQGSASVEQDMNKKVGKMKKI